MDKHGFDNLPAKTRLKIIMRRLLAATTAEEVFGASGRKAYHRLLQDVHPDKFSDPEAQAIAANVTAILTEFSNSTSKLPTLDDPNIRLLHGLRRTDIADVYLGEGESGVKVEVKVARLSEDNPLLQHEYMIHKQIQTLGPGDEIWKYFLMPVEELVPEHEFDPYASVFMTHTEYMAHPQDLYTLREAVLFFGGELPMKHIGWIWRRLISLMSFIHDIGLINASITPDSILIDPEHHGLTLDDWSHASIGQAQISSGSKHWVDHYPPEVKAKEVPQPTVDFYMAAKAMMWANPKMVDTMRMYFQWCSIDQWRRRPQSTRDLHLEWERTIFEKLGWKRQFVPMDVGFSWTWWQ